MSTLPRYTLSRTRDQSRRWSLHKLIVLARSKNCYWRINCIFGEAGCRVSRSGVFRGFFLRWQPSSIAPHMSLAGMQPCGLSPRASLDDSKCRHKIFFQFPLHRGRIAFTTSTIIVVSGFHIETGFQELRTLLQNNRSRGAFNEESKKNPFSIP
jgi:hypothetical protein